MGFGFSAVIIMKVNKIYKIILSVLYSLLVLVYVLEAIHGGTFLINLILSLFVFAALTVPQIIVYYMQEKDVNCYVTELIITIAKFVVVLISILFTNIYVLYYGSFSKGSIADFHSNIWHVIIVWAFIVLFICTIIVEIVGTVNILIKLKKSKAQIT